ncbi:hypothetical protein PG988_002304 [Apiospora saccharicola]
MRQLRHRGDGSPDDEARGIFGALPGLQPPGETHASHPSEQQAQEALRPEPLDRPDPGEEAVGIAVAGYNIHDELHVPVEERVERLTDRSDHHPTLTVRGDIFANIGLGLTIVLKKTLFQQQVPLSLRPLVWILSPYEVFPALVLLRYGSQLGALGLRACRACGAREVSRRRNNQC